MSSDLTPENEQYLQEVIARGMYSSRQDALNVAVVLLKQREEILSEVKAGMDQVERGEVRPLEMDKLREEIQHLLVEQRAQS